MSIDIELKQIVRDKYGSIAEKSAGCGCDCGCANADAADYTIMSESYNTVAGYMPEADLGLGCGIPTEFAEIKEGDTVLDLGSGAGNDVFVARGIVGETGKVIGVDMTVEMLEKANRNLARTNYDNIEFRLGEIESLPVETNSIDVIISNCVINLVPDKSKAFSEIFRTLKPGAHFCISDIVLSGQLPERLAKAAALYTGCVAGAMQTEEYLSVIKSAGFEEVAIKSKKKVGMPDEILLDFVTEKELEDFRKQGTDVFSVTVWGRKPV